MAPRQAGFGFGKGRRVIKTIIRDDALTRALERQRRWFEQHAVEDAAPVVDDHKIVSPRPHLRMAKATLPDPQTR